MNETILITGDTYPHRDALRAMGGRWDAVARGWRVPASRAAEARALVPEAPLRTGRTRGLRDQFGLCTRCGDDCGTNPYRCGYE
jgi:hypothetical protein